METEPVSKQENNSFVVFNSERLYRAETLVGTEPRPKEKSGSLG